MTPRTKAGQEFADAWRAYPGFVDRIVAIEAEIDTQSLARIAGELERIADALSVLAGFAVAAGAFGDYREQADDIRRRGHEDAHFREWPTNRSRRGAPTMPTPNDPAAQEKAEATEAIEDAEQASDEAGGKLVDTEARLEDELETRPRGEQRPPGE
jgi:hypothetical protein